MNKNFYSYFYLNVSIIKLDSEFMNLQDDFRPNDNFSCWISDSLIKICLVYSESLDDVSCTEDDGCLNY